MTLLSELLNFALRYWKWSTNSVRIAKKPVKKHGCKKSFLILNKKIGRKRTMDFARLRMIISAGNFFVGFSYKDEAKNIWYINDYFDDTYMPI